MDPDQTGSTLFDLKASKTFQLSETTQAMTFVVIGA